MSLISPAFLAKSFKEHIRSPIGFLILVSIAMPIAMSSWIALLNNFVIQGATPKGLATQFQEQLCVEFRELAETEVDELEYKECNY